MPVLVVGTVQGERVRSGNFDDGGKWSVQEASVRGDGDFEGTIIRLEDYQGDPLKANEFVVLAGELRGGKFRAQRRLPELEAALQGRKA